VTGRSSEGLDERRRRLLFRSWHRGIREVDLVLGRFADADIAEMTDAELDQFEAVLEIPTPDLLSWLMGEQPVPAEHNSPVMREVLDFHLRRKARE
jgi:antitoxin CptB